MNNYSSKNIYKLVYLVSVAVAIKKGESISSSKISACLKIGFTFGSHFILIFTIANVFLRRYLYFREFYLYITIAFCMLSPFFIFYNKFDSEINDLQFVKTYSQMNIVWKAIFIALLPFGLSIIILSI